MEGLPGRLHPKSVLNQVLHPKFRLLKPIVDVIIPAYNESQSIGLVIEAIPAEIVRHVIVCDNNSTDGTGGIAASLGATVVSAPQRGYGNACLSGMRFIAELPADQRPDIVVFLDGDYSDYPEEMPLLLDPILKGGYDMVIGSRAIGQREKGAMLVHQRFGNWLATWLIRMIWKMEFTDLGPFRAIRYNTLLSLGMQDPNFGWTVEMQVKAAKLGIKATEVPVRYRPRAHGVSKVSGSIRNSYLAGKKILETIFRAI